MDLGVLCDGPYPSFSNCVLIFDMLIYPPALKKLYHPVVFCFYIGLCNVSRAVALLGSYVCFNFLLP